MAHVPPPSDCVVYPSPSLPASLSGPLYLLAERLGLFPAAPCRRGGSSSSSRRRNARTAAVSVPKVLVRPPGEKQYEWVDLWESYTYQKVVFVKEPVTEEVRRHTTCLYYYSVLACRVYCAGCIAPRSACIAGGHDFAAESHPPEGGLLDGHVSDSSDSPWPPPQLAQHARTPASRLHPQLANHVCVRLRSPLLCPLWSAGRQQHGGAVSVP